jgi:hypothetical protein
MSYHVALGLSEAQEKTLLDLTPAQLREISPQDRLDLVLRKREIEANKRSDFWEALTAVGTVVVPLATFFGIKALWGRKR